MVGGVMASIGLPPLAGEMSDRTKGARVLDSWRIKTYVIPSVARNLMRKRWDATRDSSLRCAPFRMTGASGAAPFVLRTFPPRERGQP